MLRTALAASAGLLLAVGLAGPASAEHQEAPSHGFYVDNPGNNACTLFWSAGGVRWIDQADHDRKDAEAVIEGRKGIEQIGDICLDVVLLPQQVEFTAYSGDSPVDRHTERIGVGTPPEDFEFTMTSGRYNRMVITHVTVQVCHVRDGSELQPDTACGEPQTIERYGAVLEEERA
ncbi:hypothetical protein [Glycomyces xiaoerkulensis]|uniref:hypothetical protein n=1 Tax=Glycomyces xiaoerkulensis TaxID=2038139 RepID=UPI000C25899C|nr:hypothetical protein [Glycomyces xiaoerkulensis]